MSDCLREAYKHVSKIVLPQDGLFWHHASSVVLVKVSIDNSCVHDRVSASSQNSFYQWKSSTKDYILHTSLQHCSVMKLKYYLEFEALKGFHPLHLLTRVNLKCCQSGKVPFLLGVKGLVNMWVSCLRTWFQMKSVPLLKLLIMGRYLSS